MTDHKPDSMPPAEVPPIGADEESDSNELEFTNNKKLRRFSLEERKAAFANPETYSPYRTGKTMLIQDPEDNFPLYLAIRVRSRSWYFFKTVNYKVVRYKIGDVRVISLLEARLETARLLRELAAGRHPRQVIHAHRKFDVTVGELLEKWAEDHLKVFLSRPKDDLRRLQTHVAPLMTKRVSELTGNDLQRWMNAIAEKLSGGSANKIFRQLKSVLRWGWKQGLVQIEAPGPWSAVRQFPEGQRERYLLQQESDRLSAYLLANPGIKSDIVQMLMYTGMRRDNVQSIEWSEIDFERAVWLIPKQKAKGRRLIRVAVTDAAMVLLKRRRQEVGDSSPFVFPGDGKCGYFYALDLWWENLCRKLDLHDLHLHDLRHDYATRLAETGASLAHIQAALAHSTPVITQRYLHVAASKALRVHMEQSQQGLLIAQRTIEAAQAAESAATDIIDVDSVTETDGAQSTIMIVVDAPEDKLLPAVIERPELPQPKRTPQNAEIKITGADEIIVQAKILTVLRLGGSTRKHFWKKIGSCFNVSASEMDRILAELVERGLIESYRKPPHLNYERFRVCSAHSKMDVSPATSQVEF